MWLVGVVPHSSYDWTTIDKIRSRGNHLTIIRGSPHGRRGSNVANVPIADIDGGVAYWEGGRVGTDSVRVGGGVSSTNPSARHRMRHDEILQTQ